MPEGIVVKNVQISDLEDAAHLPPNTTMIGKQAGNYMWRSPEVGYFLVRNRCVYFLTPIQLRPC